MNSTVYIRDLNSLLPVGVTLLATLEPPKTKASSENYERFKQFAGSIAEAYIEEHSCRVPFKQGAIKCLVMLDDTPAEESRLLLRASQRFYSEPEFDETGL